MVPSLETQELGGLRMGPTTKDVQDAWASEPLVWIAGPNGCGKSTLLRELARQAPPGSLYLPQDLFARILQPTCSTEAARLGGSFEGDDRLLAQLSDGELAGFHLTYAKLKPGAWLLLDEPFEHLDDTAQAAFEQILLGHAQRGVRMAIALHGEAPLAGRSLGWESPEVEPMEILQRTPDGFESRELPAFEAQGMHCPAWSLEAGLTWIHGPNGSGKSLLLEGAKRFLGSEASYLPSPGMLIARNGAQHEETWWACSRGEQQAQALRLMMDSPGILLLDEPDQSLDAASRRYWQQAIYARSRRMPVVLISHDSAWANLADQEVVCGGT